MLSVEEKQAFLLHFSRFFVPLRLKIAKVLRLGRKNKRVCFVLRSTFRTFGYAELTMHSEMKRKQAFLLHFARFLVTLQPL